MTTLDPRTVLTAIADRVAAQVAGLGDRVAVKRALSGWDAADGPYAVVVQTGPFLPDATADGTTLVDTMRVGVAVWQAPDGTSTVVADTVTALQGWAAEGLRPRHVGTLAVPQPETDIRRTRVEVRYARPR